MYYICKFSDDGKKNNSRLLEKNEIGCLKKHFPALLLDSGKILSAIQVVGIQPNKLMKLSDAECNGKLKKTRELLLRSQGN